MLLLQSAIRCCDTPSVSGLATRTLSGLREHALGPQGSSRRGSAI